MFYCSNLGISMSLCYRIDYDFAFISECMKQRIETIKKYENVKKNAHSVLLGRNQESVIYCGKKQKIT